MVLSIKSNTGAETAVRHLGKNDGRLSASLERLSSGLRVNKAADDSSGMLIADSLNSQARGLGQAIRNANDAISIVQIADAALEESVNILNTIKTKSIQAAQDGQTTESRAAIQADIDKLMEELDTIAKTTSFNGQKLLSGNFTNKAFQIGAYSNEVVNLSIDGSSSGKIGHINTGELEITGNKEGLAALSIQNRYTGQHYEITPVEMLFDNDPEHGLGALADAVNQISDLTGIRVSARVASGTDTGVQAGTTDEAFSINNVKIGKITVMENDGDGALVKAINQRTAQHGVVASVDPAGRLSLTATDGRGILVEPGPDLEIEGRDIFGGKDLSTFGVLDIQGSAASPLDIRDLSKGDPIGVADAGLEIKGDTLTGQDALVKAGSILAAQSILASSWTMNQNISGDQLQEDIFIEETTRLLPGTILGKDSVVLTPDDLPVTLSVNSEGTTFTESLVKTGSILAKDSILGPGTQIPAGNIVSAGTLYKGDVLIDATLATTASSMVKQDSVLAAGSVIASGSTLTGTAQINAVGPLNGSALISSNSVLRAGSVIASGTTLGGNAVVAGIANTTGVYSLTAGSTLAANSEIASGTILGGDAWCNQVPNISSSYDLTANSILQTGSVLTSGAVLSRTAVIADTGPIPAGFNLIAGSILRAGSSIGAGTTLADTAVISTTGPTTGNYIVESGSTLTAGTVFGDGSILNGTATINQITATGNPGDDITLAAGTVLAAGTYIESGNSISTTSGVLNGPLFLAGSKTTTGVNTFFLTSGSIAAGSVLANGSVAGTPAFSLQTAMNPTALTTLRAGSVLGNNTSLVAGSVIGPDSASLSADLTLTNPMTLTMGSSMADNSRLFQGSTVGPGGVSLFSSLTLTGVTMTLPPGCTIAAGSRLNQGSIVGAEGLRLSAVMGLTADMDLQAGSQINTSSSFNTGSLIGPEDVILIANLTVNSPMNLAAGSSIAGLSTLEQSSLVSSDKITLASAMTLDQDMTLAAGSSMGKGTAIQYGSYLWADATLLSDMTLKESVTLASDMELNSDLILGTGSSLGDNSLIFQGSSIYLPLELLETIRLADPLVLDPGSKFSNDSETLIVSGTTVGGEASFAEVLEVQNDFILPGESILKKTSMLKNGSDIGGDIRTLNRETVLLPMAIGKGSVLAEGSLLSKGTLLANDITGTDGSFYPEGSSLDEDIFIQETELSNTMILMTGSEIAEGSLLKANSIQRHTSTRVTNTQLSTLADIQVLSGEEAQLAIGLADEALKDIDRIRASLGSVQNQLTSTIAGISTTRVNVRASASAIRDVDLSEEVQNLKKLEILAQAGRFALSATPSRTSHLLSLITELDQNG
ncbi:flagellin [Desulfospira joergensenii]|uniref:flagellin N-terminal helical domain-containing protein n=1 Tax=Desulfospira joergensenii TaxID=53329 RepID=UPI0003B7A155|nr:flagellin [Desulfospira joergensenii]